MVKRLRIIWTDNARADMRELYEYIRQDSPKNAVKVRRTISESVQALLQSPLKFPPDKYRIENDGSFRAFDLYRFRITYQVGENQIIILRIRHTSRDPLTY